LDKENRKSKTESLAEMYKISSGGELRTKEGLTEGKEREVYQTLIKMRTGCFLRSDDFLRMKKLKPELQGKCISCLATVNDTIDHLLLRCEAFREIRSETLEVIHGKLKESNRTNLEKKLISFVLEGDVKIIESKKCTTKMHELKMRFLVKFIDERKTHVRKALL
jgi:hypothetical protein